MRQHRGSVLCLLYSLLLYLPYAPTQNKYCYSGILAIICLPEFSCHPQPVTKRITIPTWDPPDWPLCQYSSSPVHTAYFDCVIRIQTQIRVAVSRLLNCLDALPSTQPSSSIDLKFMLNRISLISLLLFLHYLFWLVIILVICACILSLSSS